MRWAVIGLCASLAVAGCTTTIEISEVQMQLVEQIAAPRLLGELSTQFDQGALSNRVKVSFLTRPDLSRLADRPGMTLAYQFFACERPDQYVHSGNIFADEEAGPGYLAAYIPAEFSQLSFWVTGNGSGQIGRGWPAEVKNEALCFHVEGGVPFESVIRSNTVRLWDASLYFETGQPH
jgi:hypothetical protein